MREKFYKVFVWLLETIFHILKYIAEGIIVVAIFLAISYTFTDDIESSTVQHEEYNMCHIDDIHTYDMDTKIVYIETGLFSYTPYISENGNYYKYDPETKEIKELESEE